MLEKIQIQLIYMLFSPSEIKLWQYQLKTLKSKYPIFLVMSNFTELFCFVLIILSGIVDVVKITSATGVFGVL